jgi:hypothetical protein
MPAINFTKKERATGRLGPAIALAALHATVAGRFYYFVFATFLSELSVPRGGNSFTEINYR